MEDNGIKVYFYVTNGEININHTGSTAEELAAESNSKKNFPIILFSYDFDSKVLCAENIDKEALSAVLNSLKRKKMKKSISEEMKEAVYQLEAVAKYLRKVYGWEGEIVSKEESGYDEDKKLSLSDFKVVFDYLRLFFRNYNAEIFDIDIYIVESLDKPSVFLEDDEEYDDISGPAILLKKTNSMFAMSEAIIYQYVLNYDKIIGFDVGLREEYVLDTKDYVDDAIIGFFRNEIVDKKSFWFLEKIGSIVYLKKNTDLLSSMDLRKKRTGAIMTFEYVVSDDSRYIIFDNISRHVIRNLNVYGKMFEFLMKNLGKIGHVGSDGGELKEDPIVLFRPSKNNIVPLFLSNIPVWIFIENIFSVLYDFDPEDILVLKGEFDSAHAFKLIDDLIELKKYTGRDLEITENDLPLLLWNTKVEESAISEFMFLMASYSLFIKEENFGNFQMPKNIKEFIYYINNNVFRDKDKTYALEHAMMILIHELEHVHEYNLFKIIFDIMGFYSSIVDNYLSSIDNESDLSMVAKIVDEIHEKLYYLVLKATLISAKIRYGANISKNVKPIRGDLVMDTGMEEMMRVDMVSLEPTKVDEKTNPEGALLHCVNVFTNEKTKRTPEEVFVISFSFDDPKVYNYKRASKIVEASESNDLYPYKELLIPFIRNKKKKNPLDEDEKKKEPPTFDAYLTEQRKDFGRNGGGVIVEHLLDKCRKVRDYGQDGDSD